MASVHQELVRYLVRGQAVRALDTMALVLIMTVPMVQAQAQIAVARLTEAAHARA